MAKQGSYDPDHAATSWGLFAALVSYGLWTVTGGGKLGIVLVGIWALACALVGWWLPEKLPDDDEAGQ